MNAELSKLSNLNNGGIDKLQAVSRYLQLYIILFSDEAR